jgi:hypothetical protein
VSPVSCYVQTMSKRKAIQKRGADYTHSRALLLSMPNAPAEIIVFGVSEMFSHFFGLSRSFSKKPFLYMNCSLHFCKNMYKHFERNLGLVRKSFDFFPTHA